MVLRYTLATHEFAMLSYATRPTVFTRFINSSTVSVVYGDTTARVYTLDLGLTDNETPISFELETHDLEFGSGGIKKEITNHLMIYAENAPEAIVQIKVERDDWLTLGTVQEVIEELQINHTLAGHYFRVRVLGTSTTTAMKLQGFEFPQVTYLSYGV